MRESRKKERGIWRKGLIREDGGCRQQLRRSPDLGEILRVMVGVTGVKERGVRYLRGEIWEYLGKTYKSWERYGWNWVKSINLTRLPTFKSVP